MKNRFNIIATILFVVWGIGFIGFGIGGIIHALLVLAGVTLILRLEEPIFVSKAKAK